MLQWLIIQIRKKIDWIVANIEWILGIILSFVVGVLGFIGMTSPTIIFSVTLGVLGLLSIGSLRDRIASRHLKDVVSDLEGSDKLLADRVSTGISRVFSDQQTDDFWLTHFKDAEHVTIVAVRYGYAENRNIYQALANILKKGGSVTLVLADPRSPARWLRYKEERMPNFEAMRLQDETLLKDGLEDNARRLKGLYEWKQRLVREGRDLARLKIKVFSEYPTQAFYKFNDEIYVHDYPYAERGIHTPLFLFTNPTTPVHKFLSHCIEYLVASSVNLEDVIDDIMQKLDQRLLSDQQVFKTDIVLTTHTKLRTKRTI